MLPLHIADRSSLAFVSPPPVLVTSGGVTNPMRLYVVTVVPCTAKVMANATPGRDVQAPRWQRPRVCSGPRRNPAAGPRKQKT